MFVRFTIILLLVGFSFVFATEQTENRLQDSSDSLQRVSDVPLSKQSAYTGKGFTVGIGMGVFDATSECDCMGIWQGQLEYFYAPWFSGGIGVVAAGCYGVYQKALPALQSLQLLPHGSGFTY